MADSISYSHGRQGKLQILHPYVIDIFTPNNVCYRAIKVISTTSSVMHFYADETCIEAIDIPPFFTLYDNSTNSEVKPTNVETVNSFIIDGGDSYSLKYKDDVILTLDSHKQQKIRYVYPQLTQNWCGTCAKELNP